MYINKVFLTIILTTNAWCSDRMLVRNARTFDLSSWSQALFSNRPDSSIFPKLWPRVQSQLQEWTRNGIASLLRLASIGNKPMYIEFRSEDGPRAAKTYQQRFGYRGEWLIKQLGDGLDPYIRLNRQPMLNTFLMPPIPFRSGSNLIYNFTSTL